MHDTLTKLTLSKLFDSLTSNYPLMQFLGVYANRKFGIYLNCLKKELNHMTLQSFCMTYLTCCVDDNDAINMDFNKSGWFMFKKVREDFWLIIGSNNHDFERISGDLNKLNMDHLVMDEMFGSLRMMPTITPKKNKTRKGVKSLAPRNLNIQSIESVTARLEAAKRVQDGLLPDLKKLSNHFELFFSYYSPEDVLSGDFYWYEEKNDHVLFVVGDCTGHSVEGALATMIVNTLINQNITDNLVNTIDAIYADLRKYSSAESGYMIGVEMALCKYNRKKGMMELLSTGVPILYFDRDHSGYLLKPKGKLNINQVTDNMLHQQINVSKGERLVIYTDGLADQFDHADRKKLGNTGIKKMFESMNGNFSKETFSKEFERWKGSNSQTDDITMMAFEI